MQGLRATESVRHLVLKLCNAGTLLLYPALRCSASPVALVQLLRHGHELLLQAAPLLLQPLACPLGPLRSKLLDVQLLLQLHGPPCSLLPGSLPVAPSGGHCLLGRHSGCLALPELLPYILQLLGGSPELCLESLHISAKLPHVPFCAAMGLRGRSRRLCRRRQLPRHTFPLPLQRRNLLSQRCRLEVQGAQLCLLGCILEGRCLPLSLHLLDRRLHVFQPRLGSEALLLSHLLRGPQRSNLLPNGGHRAQQAALLCPGALCLGLQLPELPLQDGLGRLGGPFLFCRRLM
mmetsp:Transcript_38438/g.108615  ORF Transcript_38438/g.108615 Transcript_38438/m.108615 type:complete len:290 (-) Transcript_38438:1476-2345(-)